MEKQISSIFEVKDDRQYKPTSEMEIYEIASHSFDIAEKAFKNSALEKSLRGGSHLKFREKEIGHQRLFMYGEVHWTREVVDHIHRNLSKKIESDSQSWLFLQEGAYRRSVSGMFLSPAQFYVENFSKLFNIPYEDALADLTSEITRKFLKENYHFTGEQIDKFVIEANIVLNAIMFQNGKFPEEMNSKERRKLIEELSNATKKPKNYVKKLIDLPFEDIFRHKEKLSEGWDEFSKERFFSLRKKFNSKKNILIIAGQNHFTVFDS